MREDAVEQYLAYKLIDSNQDWKAKWFYITNHHPELPKPSGVGHTPRVLMQGRRKSRRRTPTRIPLYSY
jgi:hypothetical protein